LCRARPILLNRRAPHERVALGVLVRSGASSVDPAHHENRGAVRVRVSGGGVWVRDGEEIYNRGGRDGGVWVSYEARSVDAAGHARLGHASEPGCAWCFPPLRHLQCGVGAVALTRHESVRLAATQRPVPAPPASLVVAVSPAQRWRLGAMARGEHLREHVERVADEDVLWRHAKRQVLSRRRLGKHTAAWLR